MTGPVAGARLPARYQKPWDAPFEEAVRPALVPGARVLDVGGGRSPTIPRERRPPGCEYVGLDVSGSELSRAPAASYDETVVADLVRSIPTLRDRFDLAVSRWLFEHVKPLDAAIDNLRTYLRPGGRLVAEFSGAFSAFAIINGVLPRRLGVWGMNRLLGRAPESVFPAHYHHCWHSALERILQRWTSFEILPRYAGAHYFAFSPLLQSAYLRYENWTYRGGHPNLATHYLITAVR